MIPLSAQPGSAPNAGGVERFVQMLASKAGSLGFDLTILGTQRDVPPQGDVRVIPVSKGAASELAFTLALRRIAIFRKHDWLPESGVILANAEHYVWALRDCGLPIVLVSHGIIPVSLVERGRRVSGALYRRFIERLAIASVAAIVAVSAAVYEYYATTYPEATKAKMYTVPLGVDVDEFRSSLDEPRVDLVGIGNDSPLVLFVGRLSREKNVSLFIDACRYLREAGTSLQALVIGDGIEAPLVQGAMREHRWLHWIPSVSHDQVVSLMANAAALCVTSRYESGPLVTMEALASGLPIVSTDVGRSREFLVPPYGLVTKPDPKSVSEGLSWALSIDAPPRSVRAEAMTRRIDFSESANALAAILRRAASSPARLDSGSVD